MTTLISAKKRPQTYLIFLFSLTLILLAFSVADYYLVEWVKTRVGVEGIQPYHVGMFLILYTGIALSLASTYFLLTREPIGSILTFTTAILMLLFLWEDVVYYTIGKARLGTQYQWNEVTWLWFQQYPIFPQSVTTTTILLIAVTGLITITLITLLYTRKARHLPTA